VTSRGIVGGPASAGVGFSGGASCRWSPAVLELASEVQIRSGLGAIEFFSASGITGFRLTSEAVAVNGREIVIQIHGVSG
jgi:hypothetical protein